MPVRWSKSSFLVDAVEKRGEARPGKSKSANGDTSGNNSGLPAVSSSAWASKILTGSSGDDGAAPKFPQSWPALADDSDNWPCSHRSRWMRGMLWSRGKSRSSMGMATSMAAKRASSHLTKVWSSTQDIKNWSVSARTRMT